jgi:hypothetical protein
MPSENLKRLPYYLLFLCSGQIYRHSIDPSEQAVQLVQVQCIRQIYCTVSYHFPRTKDVRTYQIVYLIKVLTVAWQF